MIQLSFYLFPRMTYDLKYNCLSVQGNVAPPPVAPQPTSAVKFIPTNPPALRNVGKYQQPTLGAHLYPVCYILLGWLEAVGHFFVVFKSST